MQYKYTENEDFSFLSSGNVIKHFKGMPCFPVRLSLELFETAFERIGKDKITVYDPCCGNGFSLTVLGMMKQDKMSHLYGSDVEESCAEAALCNLSMITEEGIAAARDRVLSNPETTEARREQITSSVEKILPY